MKFLKVGRVAIITRGRYAGKKVRILEPPNLFAANKTDTERRSLGKDMVVIIQPVDSGNKAHPYGHALVAGIERYPSKITRRMSKARQEKRSKIKPFVKVVNYNHLMPTRYTLELEGLKGAITSDTFKEVSQREDAKKTVKKTLEERYTSGKNRWFFTPLSMSSPNRDGEHQRDTSHQRSWWMHRCIAAWHEETVGYSHMKMLTQTFSTGF
ncbi:60S ribosomal protein L27-A [Diaporthe helianthi]|uniref:60S ribosomal protein L27-A n=1 Tax=Diaporthe helianthi TaxID=158607 RepID=A0A2P5I5I0_DIAHE|nr:60S ribosomal protein L27-A [Diaporthe helianthi]